MTKIDILKHIITKGNCNEIYCSGRENAYYKDKYLNKIECPLNYNGDCVVRNGGIRTIRTDEMTVLRAKEELQAIEKLNFLEKLK